MDGLSKQVNMQSRAEFRASTEREDQTPPDRSHESSSVGPRPSSAAPIGQYPRAKYTKTPARHLPHSAGREKSSRMRLGGAARGRLRSDRRASPSPINELLF